MTFAISHTQNKIFLRHDFENIFKFNLKNQNDSGVGGRYTHPSQDQTGITTKL